MIPRPEDTQIERAIEEIFRDFGLFDFYVQSVNMPHAAMGEQKFILARNFKVQLGPGTLASQNHVVRAVSDAIQPLRLSLLESPYVTRIKNEATTRIAELEAKVAELEPYKTHYDMQKAMWGDK